MREYSATELANKTGDVLSAAAQDAVEITRHGKPRFVLMSRDRYERLVSRTSPRRAIKVRDMSDKDRRDVLGALEAELDHD